MRRTYSKLSNLGIVNSHDFVLLRGTQTKARDEVDEEKDDTAADKRVCEARHRVCELVAQLDVVVVDPAAVNLGRAVEVSNVITVLVSPR